MLDKIDKKWNSLEETTQSNLKTALAYLISILIFVVFHPAFEKLLNESIEEYLFRYVESKWYNDIIIIITVILTLVYSFYLRKRRKLVPSKKLIGLILSAAIVYFIYRFLLLEPNWEFTSFYTLNKWFDITSVKYLDLLFISATISQLILIKGGKRPKLNSNPENSFAEDSPLENENDDLGYKAYAKTISKRIKGSSFDNNSFAIGINGRWGTGKSSFINLLKKNFEAEKGKSEIIEIDFNPWRSYSPEMITKDFFATVESELGKYHSSISRLLINYSNKLVAYQSNAFTQAAQAVIASVTGVDSIDELHKQIKAALKDIGKKLIVYIDDVDRLDKDEILEVIRLVRNTANFPYTFFVVAYDRDYLINALESHNVHNKESFLEKIFQIEITLPYYRKQLLYDKVIENLVTRFPKPVSKEIEKILSADKDAIPSSTSFYSCVINTFDNMRDVVRYTNSVLLNLEMLTDKKSGDFKMEIDLIDFLKIEILRLKYPSLYTDLKNRRHIYITASSEPYGKRYYFLNRDNNSSAHTQLQDYIENNCPTLSIAHTEKGRVFILLKNIFEPEANTLREPSSKSIRVPSRFEIYFTYSIPNYKLSDIEFANLREQDDIKTFYNRIDNWIDNGVFHELKEKLESISDYNSVEDYEKMIRVMFYFYNKIVDDKTLPNDFNYDALNKQLQMSETIYIDNVDEKDRFIEDIFRVKDNRPLITQSSLLRYVDHKSDVYPGNFPISKESNKLLRLSYFKDYCKENEYIDNNMWAIFINSRLLKIDGSKYETLEETMSLMREFAMEKDLSGFLQRVTNEKVPSEKQSFVISSIAYEVFGNKNVFYRSVMESELLSESYKLEFKNFFEKLKSNRYQAVDFSFNEIKVMQ